MTQEDKQLLLKDLCGRLPYGVKVQVQKHISINDLKVYGIETPYRENLIQKRNEHYLRFWNDSVANIDICKPYLRPMSSMTEEEVETYHNLQSDVWKPCGTMYYDNIRSIDWLNEHHFDYRRLIEKGLALVALEGMYK